MTKRLIVVGIVALACAGLVACGETSDISRGNTVSASVQRDPIDPCRVVVTRDHDFDRMPAFTAHVDGCVSGK